MISPAAPSIRSACHERVLIQDDMPTHTFILAEESRCTSANNSVASLAKKKQTKNLVGTTIFLTERNTGWE